MALPPPEGVAQEASRHFERGIKLSEEEDWQAALVEFERAYSVYPNYRVLFDIGQCRYQIRDYPGALAAFQRYLQEGKDLVPADRRAQVTSDIDLLKGRVATVRVSSKLAGAEVRIDDVVVGMTPLASPIAVSAGRRKITLSKAGATGATRYVDLAGEEAAEVTLDPEAPSDEPSTTFVPFSTKMPSPDAPSSGSSRLAAWIAVGFGAVGVGVGTFFGITAMGDKSNLDRQCVDKSCPGSSQSLISASQRDSLISTIGFGVGAAGVLGGVAYLALVPGAGRKRATAPSVGLFVGATSVGAAGSF